MKRRAGVSKIAHPVKCIYCKQSFDRDKIPFVQVSERRYAHKDCHERGKDKKEKDELDRLALEDYISKHICPEGYVTPRVRKQMQSYIKNYNYTYSGMLKALVYFYEVQGNSYEKANGGIGIIPYTYSNAYQYYFAIWLANNNNSKINFEDFNIKQSLVKINPPKRKKKRKKLFSFLDKEEENNE